MRERLPDRRASWTQKVHIDGQPVYLCVGEYPDGRPGEVFVDMSRTGTFARGVMDALARMASMALQCGAPLHEVVRSLRGLNFPPNGPVSGSPNVTEALSVADWIASELEATYLAVGSPDGS
jgi:ribonucleoside-diphosphate reductase alpha chain